MAGKSWHDLDPRIQRVLLAAGAVESGLKIAALVDLARRPAREVRGSKARWAIAITFLNSVGAVPVAYFLRGRIHPDTSSGAVIGTPGR